MEPEEEAAALLLFLGLPARAILGKARAFYSEWVWWVWGSGRSNSALVPARAALRLAELKRELLAKRGRAVVGELESRLRELKRNPTASELFRHWLTYVERAEGRGR